MSVSLFCLSIYISFCDTPCFEAKQFFLSSAGFLSVREQKQQQWKRWLWLCVLRAFFFPLLWGSPQWIHIQKPPHPLDSILTHTTLSSACCSSQRKMFSSHGTALTPYLPRLSHVSFFFSTHGRLSWRGHEKKIYMGHSILSFTLIHTVDMQDRWCKTLKVLYIPPQNKRQDIIHNNENTFCFRGQTVFIISHNHSWLPFNAGPAAFMHRTLLVSKQWKALVLQVVGMVTTVHWCIVFYSCFLEISKDVQF